MGRSKQADTKPAHRLTPHTLRLIKLITSCSSSSENDHVRHAISLLSKIASKSHPYHLWDILARLYSSLTNPEDSGSGVGDDGGDCIIKREYIALAMEHIARYIPSSDRRHFLLDDSSCSKGTSTSNYKTWLKVRDFLPVTKSNASAKDKNDHDGIMNGDQMGNNGDNADDKNDDDDTYLFHDNSSAAPLKPYASVMYHSFSELEGFCLYIHTRLSFNVFFCLQFTFPPLPDRLDLFSQSVSLYCPNRRRKIAEVKYLSDDTNVLC